jgi:DNA-binding transcriptional MerR regulator
MVEYLRVAAAADFLSVHPETIRRWERKGLVSCYRNSNGHRVFSLSDLLEVKRRREREGLCNG